MRTRPLLTLVASGLLLGACTKPPAAAPVAGSTAPQATNGRSLAATPVTLFNAFTASERDADGQATAPARTFPAGTVVLVGTVLHGQAPAAKVEVEWGTTLGTLVGKDAVDTAVMDATVATIPLNKGQPLPAGSYKALVRLDGAPSWELMFEVSP